MTISQVAPAVVAPPPPAPGASAPPASRAPAPTVRARRRRLPPPARLVVQATAALVAVVALCLAVVVGAVTVRSDAERLRDTAAHRAAVAAELGFALADLDAQRANQLVPGHAADDPEVSVGNRLLALITAQQRRAQASELLRQLGGDEAHAAQVRGILDLLGRYDDAGGRAAYVDEQHHERAAGHPPAVAVAFSAEAGDIMHSHLLPKVAALANAYDAQAVAASRGAQDAALGSAVAVGVLGLAAVAVLLWWQRDLTRRYLRMLNPALAAATAVVLGVALAGVVSFTGAAADLGAGTRDGLRPWSRLAQARAVAAEAAAAQSRWLVNGAEPQQRAELDTLDRRLGGLLAPGGWASADERPAYADVNERYGHFRADDRKLVELMAGKRIDEAAVVLTDVGRGEVGFDFWDFATTLDALARHQQADFVSRTDAARSGLDGWPEVPAGLLGIAAVLVVVGVWPRLAEYR
ncbi:hypothetical protein ACFYWP_12120 [Actinacidiphila glaucinigra]|uniref:hypothetical protein n=1 Tax=Actinacidiphila glaucinigra TaxID=235986 RepID=UPI00368943C6